MGVLGQFRLDGKVAIVTGASRGIGESIARALAEAGAFVVVTGRKPGGCEAVATSIRQSGGQAASVATHMGEPVAIDALVQATVELCGGIDIVVNNAATSPVFGPLVDAGATAFQKIYDVNVRGPFLLANKAHPHLVARGGGSLIHISSIGGISPEPHLGLYSSSKAALISLSKAMALEWGRDNIRSNVICPGLVKTKFSQPLWDNDAIKESVVSHQPLSRVAEPEEIAPLALFLASAASSYCTGGVYTVDGGHTI